MNKTTKQQVLALRLSLILTLVQHGARLSVKRLAEQGVDASIIAQIQAAQVRMCTLMLICMHACIHAWMCFGRLARSSPYAITSYLWDQAEWEGKELGQTQAVYPKAKSSGVASSPCNASFSSPPDAKSPAEGQGAVAGSATDG